MSEMNQHPIIGIEPEPDSRLKLLWHWIRRPEHSNAFTAIATVVYALFTIILTVVSIFQWREIQNNKADTQRLLTSLDAQAVALKAMAAAAQRQAVALATQAEATTSQAVSSKDYANAAMRNANAASESARLAGEAADFSRGSFRTSHRAYMVIDHSALAAQVVANKPLNVNVSFRNVGQTPALAVNAGWEFYALVVGEQIKPLPSLGLPKLGASTIGPNGSFEAHPEVPLSSEVSAALAEGKVFLAVRMIVVYKDIFGEVHATEECGCWSSTSKVGLGIAVCQSGLLDQVRFY